MSIFIFFHSISIRNGKSGYGTAFLGERLKEENTIRSHSERASCLSYAVTTKQTEYQVNVGRFLLNKKEINIEWQERWNFKDREKDYSIILEEEYAIGFEDIWMRVKVLSSDREPIIIYEGCVLL